MAILFLEKVKLFKAAVKVVANTVPRVASKIGVCVRPAVSQVSSYNVRDQ